MILVERDAQPDIFDAAFPAEVAVRILVCIYGLLIALAAKKESVREIRFAAHVLISIDAHSEN